MNTPTALPVRDALTGDPVSVWPNDEAHRDPGGAHHVVLGCGMPEVFWLTPSAAVALAESLRQAAAVIVAQEGN
jgi:hypothetical protein